MIPGHHRHPGAVHDAIGTPGDAAISGTLLPENSDGREGSIATIVLPCTRMSNRSTSLIARAIDHIRVATSQTRITLARRPARALGPEQRYGQLTGGY